MIKISKPNVIQPTKYLKIMKIKDKFRFIVVVHSFYRCQHMNETFKAAIIPSVYFMNIYDQRTVGIHNRTSPFKICMKL